MFPTIASFPDIYISQGSVATHWKCGTIFASVITLLQIFQRMSRWKNLENGLIFGEDTDTSLVACFWLTVYKATTFDFTCKRHADWGNSSSVVRQVLFCRTTRTMNRIRYKERSAVSCQRDALRVFIIEQ